MISKHVQIINVVKNIEPLREYFLELDVLWPNDQPLVLKSLWVNFQKKYEFNPPHTHDDDLSFVIYTKIPDGLEEECKTSVSNSPGPGCIVFDFNMPSDTPEELWNLVQTLK